MTFGANTIDITKKSTFLFQVKSMRRMPSLKKVERSGIQKVTNLIRQMTGIGNTTGHVFVMV